MEIKISVDTLKTVLRGLMLDLLFIISISECVRTKKYISHIKGDFIRYSNRQLKRSYFDGMLLFKTRGSTYVHYLLVLGRFLIF